MSAKNLNAEDAETQRAEMEPARRRAFWQLYGRRKQPSVARALLRATSQMGQTLELLDTDIREFRVRLIREDGRRVTLLEPISFTAPSIARPYCCYMNTVIFYHVVHLLTPCGRAFRQWEERLTLLHWESTFRLNDRIYTAGGGEVIRYRAGWWMKRFAVLKETCGHNAFPG